MNKTDVKKIINYISEGPYKKIFYDGGGIKAQIVCLKAGQTIPPCKMNNDVLFYIIKGEGEIMVDNETEDLKEMVSVIVPRKAESRSISAKTDMIILAVQGRTNNEK
jgi:quercetin dioxygenase-like cupin family protein